MGAKAFVDTNVLLRALLSEMDGHQAAITLIRRLLAQETELWISGQIIREFIVQASHPNTLQVPLTMEAIIRTLDTIKPVYRVADETAAVRARLLELLLAYPTRGKQIHDANLVATMLAYEIDTLLTFNVADFKRFSDRITLITPEQETQ